MTSLRQTLRPAAKQRFTGFRIRGPEVSRVEGFSDAVFGFALTLLVVSLEVPKSFKEMYEAMKGFPAFLICFTLFYTIWNEHYAFFRKYGLEDGAIRWLNGALMFVILWFVYPLKFLFTMLMAGFTGATIGTGMSTDDARLLMVIYSLGYAAISILFALMYRHALARKVELELSDAEIELTRLSIQDHLGSTLIAGISIAIAMLASPINIQFAGWIYGLVGAHKWRIGVKYGRLREMGLLDVDAPEPTTAPDATQD